MLISENCYLYSCHGLGQAVCYLNFCDEHMNQFPNVDEHEIARFERLSQLWWQPGSKLSMLHVINPLRMNFICSQANIHGARVLDLGCGGGILSEAMSRAGAHVVGLDQSPQTLEVARRHATENKLNIDYRLQTVEELVQEEAGSYDMVTCMEMLEHVPEPGRIVEACGQLIKPQGQIFFATINRTFKAWLFVIIGGEYLLGFLPRGTHNYTKFVRPHELRHWAATAGLSFVHSASLTYNLLTKKFQLVHGLEDVNYMLCFSRKT